MSSHSRTPPPESRKANRNPRPDCSPLGTQLPDSRGIGAAASPSLGLQPIYDVHVVSLRCLRPGLEQNLQGPGWRRPGALRRQCRAICGPPLDVGHKGHECKYGGAWPGHPASVASTGCLAPRRLNNADDRLFACHADVNAPRARGRSRVGPDSVLWVIVARSKKAGKESCVRCARNGEQPECRVKCVHIRSE